jgi:hypothetical protein
MLAISSYRTPSSFTCLPHDRATMHLLLSRPGSVATPEPKGSTQLRRWDAGVADLLLGTHATSSKLLSAPLRAAEPCFRLMSSHEGKADQAEMSQMCHLKTFRDHRIPHAKS